MPFWGKSSNSGSSNNSESNTQAIPPLQPLPNSSQQCADPSSAGSGPSLSKPRLPRDEIADNDLQDFLTALETHHAQEEAARSIAQRSSPSSGTNSSKYEPTSQERKRFENEDFTTSFPTEMSCLDAFDRVWYCYSLGGQFLNVYRYGTLRDCSTETADWRFCMKTKVYGPATRRAMIYARNKEKAAKYKTNPSSEEVWTARTKPTEHLFEGWSGDSGKVDV